MLGGGGNAERGSYREERSTLEGSSMDKIGCSTWRHTDKSGSSTWRDQELAECKDKARGGETSLDLPVPEPKGGENQKGGET